ncbi:hypothetical protein [Pyxidicoccus xibeiensis]|uniref:hypothetical protein n=1 Tax=Pyxidicoccus xibeiensis TaxID=2906759 RepID=UPI0020A77221|nr:hypothetical protein [Pyxidicoccus xibeiensis]MCP3140006.1 hypothetical protein [Pyxidicoccus xibeiensis]
MPSRVLRVPSWPLLALLVCVSALLFPASRAAAEPGIRILNSLSTHSLARNALTANRASLRALASGPLSSSAFATHPSLRHQLEDPWARDVMNYLVQCALPTGRTVSWWDRRGVGYIFTGKAGLCPEWEFGAPSLTCQGYVTGCLLARNNAYGLAVEVSLRGEHPTAPARLNPSGLSVEWSPMFLPCPAGAAGLTAECGWVGEGVGTCTPGAEVMLAAGAPYPDTCTGQLGKLSGDRVLRVCREPAGCSRAGRLAETDHNNCGGITPSVTFTCPASGSYSVMSAPYSRATPPGTWVWPQAWSSAASKYPAAPFGAFTFREGAFYGNLFDADALATEVLLDPQTLKPYYAQPSFTGVVYKNVHACHGRDWVSGDAHLSSRICANSSRLCLANTVGPCEPGGNTSLPPRCAVNDGSRVLGDGDFESCRDAAGFLHPEPVTVYLRSPCDGLPASAREVCAWECGALACTYECRPKSPSECTQKYSPAQ